MSARRRCSPPRCGRGPRSSSTPTPWAVTSRCGWSPRTATRCAPTAACSACCHWRGAGSPRRSSWTTPRWPWVASRWWPVSPGPEQSQAVGPLWAALTTAFADLPGHDVIVDAGRAHSNAVHLPLLQQADVVVCVMRPHVAGVVHARERLRGLQDRLRQADGSGPRVGLVCVDDVQRQREALSAIEAVQFHLSWVESFGQVALDPKAARMFDGFPVPRPERSMLVRSGQRVADTLASSVRPSAVASPADPAEPADLAGPTARSAPVRSGGAVASPTGEDGAAADTRAASGPVQTATLDTRPPDPRRGPHRPALRTKEVATGDHDDPRHARSRHRPPVRAQDAPTGRRPAQPAAPPRRDRGPAGHVHRGRAPVRAVADRPGPRGPRPQPRSATGKVPPTAGGGGGRRRRDPRRALRRRPAPAAAGGPRGREHRHQRLRPGLRRLRRRPRGDGRAGRRDRRGAGRADPDPRRLLGLSSRPFDSANPQLDLRLPDGSRLSAVMDVCARPEPVDPAGTAGQGLPRRPRRQRDHDRRARRRSSGPRSARARTS